MRRPSRPNLGNKYQPIELATFRETSQLAEATRRDLPLKHLKSPVDGHAAHLSLDDRGAAAAIVGPYQPVHRGVRGR